MVASGMGTTVLPCTATRLHSTSDSLLAYRPFTKPAPTRIVSLAWRKSFPRPRAIEAVRQAIMTADLPCVEKIKPGRR
jgi:LysR family hydrogen peroxide-inducible transcriptional activator